jgi:Tat protein translocase TatB subunit
MFSGIGIWEVLLVIVVVLIVLGPQRVPEIARKIGQAVRFLRKASNDFTTAVTRDIDINREEESRKSPLTSTPPPAKTTPANISPVGKRKATESSNPPKKTEESEQK